MTEIACAHKDWNVFCLPCTWPSLHLPVRRKGALAGSLLLLAVSERALLFLVCPLDIFSLKVWTQSRFLGENFPGHPHTPTPHAFCEYFCYIGLEHSARWLLVMYFLLQMRCETVEDRDWGSFVSSSCFPSRAGHMLTALVKRRREGHPLPSES